MTITHNGWKPLTYTERQTHLVPSESSKHVSSTMQDRILNVSITTKMENVSRAFVKFCGEEGIHLEYMNIAIPQQNSIAKQPNRMIKEAITCMLAETNLSESF